VVTKVAAPNAGAPPDTRCPSSALGGIRRGSSGIAALTLITFFTSLFSPTLAAAQAPDETPSDSPARAPAEPTAPPSDDSSSDTPSTVDTSSAAEGETDEKSQDALLDHIKEEAGIEDESAEGTTASLDGIGRANVTLPTADSSGVTGKQISIPKGEGTIKGMEESFSAQLSTGIATFSVPLSLPAARGKAQPSLSLSYSSSSGLGLAGMGWSIGVPFIARQTDRGLPKYDDRVGFHHEQDRFVFNGGQELVPICTVDPNLDCIGALEGLAAPPGSLPANGVIDEQMPDWAAGWQYFRPRVEGSFLRFFWSPSHATWRVQDKSGVTMELGVPLNDTAYRSAVETNPSNTDQIFRWHLVRQYDIYGETQIASPQPNNGIVYRYMQDGGQAYLTDIFSTPPATNPDGAPLSQYAQHTRVAYETRPDVTQSYRSGWLMQQSLRLTRVDVTSKSFAGAIASARELVRRYHLQYDQASHVTLLESVQVEGRCDDTLGTQVIEAAGQSLPSTNCPRLPPMRFEYTRVAGHLADGTVTTSSLPGYEPFDERVLTANQSPPHSLDEQETTLMDVNGDSLTDVLVTAGGVYGGKHGVFFNGGSGVATGFEQDQIGIQGVLGANANVIKLSNFNVVPLDGDGDGLANLLHMPMVKTYAMYDPVFSGGTWRWVGRAITTASNNNPKVDFGNDTLDIKTVDVNFDGLVDVVASQGTEFQTFFALGRYPKGDAQFGYATRTGKETATISNNPVRMCVPWSSTPVRLSDADTELADMNGDGITDIVRLRRGAIQYWPGRGNGYWGTGDLNDCPEGTFDQNGDLKMDESPFYTDIQGTSLRLDDVNGDGLSDLVQVNFTDVSVWLNVNGTGWTDRYIIDNTPASPAYANRVRLADVNASGTPDILWGDGNSYKYIDLAGGVRPHLLKEVRNGLGKTTEITYGTSAQEMLDAKNAGKEWSSKMPTLVHVVKRVTEKDNLTIAGRPPATYVTEYTYRDPVYEGRQREFRGFREAEAKKVGDSNSPTSVTRSVFLLGECRDETPNNNVEDCSNPERWRDNPREALKGLPVVTETRAENGVYLSTTHNKYTLRHLYEGLDGRAVRYAFLSETDNYLYDTDNFDAASSTSDVLVAQVETQQDDHFALDNDLPSESAPLVKRSTAGRVKTHSQTFVDGFGNQTQQIASGVVEPIADLDEEITSTSVPLLIDEPSRWLWRTARSYVQGDQHGTQRRNDTRNFYNANGDLIQTEAVLDGTLPLARDESEVAGKHPLHSDDATLVLAVNTYDDSGDNFGNLTMAQGAGQRASEVTYDDQYRQLPVTETIYAGGQDLSDIDALNPGTDNPLTTTAEYDRGLGVVTAATDANLQPTTILYDNFGRLIELYKPDPDQNGMLSPKPSVRIQYFLPPISGPAHSIIHTETQDGEMLDDESYLESWAYVDGLGRTIVTLSEAEPEPNQTQSDAQRWIVGNLSEWDQKSALRRKYLEFFYPGDPMTFNFGSKPNGPYGRQRYDAFGRQLQTFDLDGTVTLQSEYHALSTDLWDAADLEPGGTHAGSFASETKDGHGRTVETAERFRVEGSMETRYTRTQYLPTGEPEVIRRVRGSNDDETTRWFVYDSLGRMVLNVEPHTSVDYLLNGSPNDDYQADFSGITAWRYAYNNAGDLVGTSDARGCGSNYFYDAAGRLVGEDFFPCDGENAGDQPNYSAPEVVAGALTGNSLEVFYEYDAAVTDAQCDIAQTNLKGRLSRVRDQARTTLASYDARGRSELTAARIAKPGSVEEALDDRYTARCYRKEFSYDAADRPLTETTGAQLLMGAVGQSSDPESFVRYEYSQRGAIANVQSSYGGPDEEQAGQGASPYLVSEIVRTADNRVEKIEYGDLAKTATTYTYDDRRRVQSVVTSRAPPDVDDVWPEGFETQSPLTFQLLLQDEEYSYDVVNNPTEIRDWRDPAEWPEGAKPVSKRIDYDDLYRASRISYEYTTGDDTWKSPFDAENQSPSEIDPRRAAPSPHVSFAKRILWQSYRYDWLGNQSKTDDDVKGFYDRSLGTVTNGEEDGTEDKVPYQLKSATQPGSNGGSLETHYDAAGNLTRLLVDRSGSCLPTLPTQASCDQWFEYTWDEVGRLSRARRWDGLNLATANVDTDPEPGSTPAADLTYRYDADDNRVLKTATDASSNQSHAVYIFASLELRGTTFDIETADDYHLDTTTEVVYLFANGVRLARVHYEEAVDPLIWTPANGVPNTRVFFELGDHLGSTSVVLDKATSELVERSTFQAYGGAESDYRTERWKNFREDYRFTGKEEDVEVGLQYFGKRYLNPLLGRWVSADPLEVHAAGSADGNLYAYVRGLILKAIDPLGMQDNNGGAGGATSTGGGGSHGAGNNEASGTSAQADQQYNMSQAYQTGHHNAGASARMTEKVWNANGDEAKIASAIDEYNASIEAVPTDPAARESYEAGFDNWANDRAFNEFVFYSAASYAVAVHAPKAGGSKGGGGEGSKGGGSRGTATAENTPASAAEPVAPAHPTFQPGPYAAESIPARSQAQTFNAAERTTGNAIGDARGCHTCGAPNPGTKSGNWVLDHQPVSAFSSKATTQRLYPQCLTCSREQGLAVARALRAGAVKPTDQ
jgi:RHS repeat-associated protein